MLTPVTSFAAPDALEQITMVNQDGETTVVPIPENVSQSPVYTPSVEGTKDIKDLQGSFELNPVDPADVGARDAAVEYGWRPAIPPKIKKGQPSTQVIIGSDNRTEVVDVTASPYSQIPLILYKRGTSSYMCTGALVGNSAVTTAGHCLYNPQTKEWATEISVSFAVKGKTRSFACYPSEISVSNGWLNSGAREFDFGVIKLACNAGTVQGHMGYKNPGTGAVAGIWNVTGYPQDKASLAGGYFQYTHAGALTSANARQFSYQIDTVGGQSGSPIWRLERDTSCGYCVIGVHTAGSETANYGTRLNDAYIATIVAASN